MIVMYLSTFIIKSLFFTIIKPPFLFKNRGRHSGTDIPKIIIHKKRHKYKCYGLFMVCFIVQYFKTTIYLF